MEHARIYEDGTAELILLRTLLPWAAVAWAFAATVYFTGLLPANDALGHAEYGILRALTYVGGVGIALAALVVAVTRPPRIRLPKQWIVLALGGAALSFAGVMMLFRFTGK